jgi:ABC transport system ATP-binding/permease protein
MRESVLLALIHIFAMVSTVSPVGVSARGKKILRGYLRRYLNRELEEEYFSLFESNLEFYSQELKGIDKEELADESSLIAFQITNICRQIKKGLYLDERMIVFLQLLEFAFEDGLVTEQEKTIIDIVSRTFNISKKEYDNSSAFMIGRNFDQVSSDCILIIEGESKRQSAAKLYKNYNDWHHLKIRGFKGQLFVLLIESTGSLILTYDGSLSLYFKGRDIIAWRPYLLDPGVNIKGPGFEPILYSIVYKSFLQGSNANKLVFEGHDIEFFFKNSDNGVQPMSFKVESGNLVGIIGGSGVGKTTLLKVLNGKQVPTSGNIFINGYDLHSETKELKGLIGYVPQDDMLIEELTVFQNLYFNARLCFGDYDEGQLKELVDKVLFDLDLYEIKDLQVGDPLNKKVSGGQRKRLNIGLELMREPVVLFVDEPTSGLSSHDSEMVMSLLKQQALHGKLVFIIIHQPSSNILKMFDRLWLLDKGGYMIYDGDPVEALVYFKTESSQANAAESECPNCGNVNTENILNIIEAKVVNNDGHPGKERQISPEDWYKRYLRKMKPDLKEKPEKVALPKSNFKVPRKLYQIKTFVFRNYLRKMADRQYIVINLVEPPLLAFILGYFSKYSTNGAYDFSQNQNYPVFLFMAIVVALFLGLTVSAEEIFKDRKILEREKYLNISRLSYLISKVNFLFILSAIQTLIFVLVSSAILEIEGMLWRFWLILFTTACFGNLAGLNISAGMRSVISIYILIPLILVPQLLLGGAMIRFDDLHKSISKKIYVPIVGDIMATRWAYEAITVEQFKSNKYEKPFFKYEMEISQNDWYASFLIPSLKVKIEENKKAGINEEYRDQVNNNFTILNYHFDELSSIAGVKPGTWINNMERGKLDSTTAKHAALFLDSLKRTFRMISYKASSSRDSIYKSIVNNIGINGFLVLKEKTYNENLATLALNRNSISKIYETEDKLIQKADPVFMKPGSKSGRAHFFAPYKQLGSLKINTLIFNLVAVWLMTSLLFITLYINLIKRFLNFIENLRLPRLRKYKGQIF